MSEQALWAIAWLVAGFVIGFLVCSLFCLRQIEKSFDDGYKLGRAFDDFDKWFRENFGDRYGD